LRVLFDKNVPHGVRYFLNQHHVETVEDRRWERIGNGELMQAAESAGFDVVVTADQNIAYQQNLSGRKIALLVLGSNIWPIVRNHAAAIASQVDATKPGSYAFLEMRVPAKPRRKKP
jgi:predicted nuclease of predicted toxin-antitoxin system